MRTRLAQLGLGLVVALSCVLTPVGAIATPIGPTTSSPTAAGAPDLGISAPARVHLHIKRWAKVRVKVTNRGNGPATAVRLRAAGSGVTFKSRSIAIGTIPAGKSRTKVIRVRVKSKNERLVTYGLTASTTSYAYDSTRLLPKYKRKKPVAGSYKGKASGRTVQFKITKARQLKGWRTTMQVRCGGYPYPLYYQVGHYNFPKRIKIGRGGRINATHKGKGYSVNLRGTFDGKRVRDGYFRYSGPNRCQGTVTWSAKRVGH